MKNLLVTHVDLDGISPIILLNLTGIKFTYKSIEINEVADTFNEILNNKPEQYDQIYVTDLTLPECIYNRINELNLKNIKVFDHHETHLYANSNDYVQVSIDIDGRQTCGTELFYLYLKDIYPSLNKPNIKEYVNFVRQLDTYHFESELPKKIDGIRVTLGNANYIKSITKRLKKDSEHFELTTFEKRYIKLKEDKILRYMQKKDELMVRCLIDGKKCGVVFAETNKSELGNYLSNKYPELDLIILIDASSRISYRTSRNDVAVNTFASNYGGGGHQKASGSKFDDDDRFKILENYYKDIKKLDN